MNKTFLLVAQIFAILGAIGYGFIGLIYFSVFSYYSVANTLLVPILIYVAIGVLDIVAAVMLNKARNNQASSNVALGWSIFLLIGAGLIGGIFGILGAQGVGGESTTVQPTVNSLEAKLEEIDRLYNRGLLTRDEYLVRRKKIILED